jgi:hypothetical protein
VVNLLNVGLVLGSEPGGGAELCPLLQETGHRHLVAPGDSPDTLIIIVFIVLMLSLLLTSSPMVIIAIFQYYYYSH